ncbi:MAG: alpha/beta hydrolase [Actinomycetia bacterium]|nr:alpha/beta hydrolase [Actinomycetes bacterium]
MREPTTILIPSEDGVEVAVHDYGGSGQPTLFLHGTGLCSRMWEPVMEQLPEAVFRPVGVDLRGHAATKTPADVTFFDHRMVTDLSAVVDALELDEAWAVGHSMGAGTTILTSLARPGRIGRIWAYEPIVMERGDNHEPLELMVEVTRKRRAVFANRAEAGNRWASRPPLDELSSSSMEVFLRHALVDRPDGQVELACPPELEARAFDQFLQQGWDQLPQVRVPVLVAWGEASDDGAGTTAPAIADRLPRGTGEVFPGARHFGPFGAGQHTARSIVSWFGP